MVERRYHFDRWGNYLGYVDQQHQYFDKNGTYRGLVGGSGAVHDEHGVYRGQIDVLGQYWDEHGNYRGYLLAPALPRRPPLQKKSRESEPGNAPAAGSGAASHGRRTSTRRH